MGQWRAVGVKEAFLGSVCAPKKKCCDHLLRDRPGLLLSGKGTERGQRNCPGLTPFSDLFGKLRRCRSENMRLRHLDLLCPIFFRKTDPHWKMETYLLRKSFGRMRASLERPWYSLSLEQTRVSSISPF